MRLDTRSIGTPRRLALGLLLLSACLLGGPVGCEEVRVRTQSQGNASAEGTGRPSAGAVRALLSLEGLTALYRARQTRGLQLERSARTAEIRGRSVSIGPLEANVALDRWDHSLSGRTLRLDFDANDVSVVVPIRVPRRVGVRICRVRLEAAAWRFSLPIERPSSPVSKLKLAGAPTLDRERTTFSWVEPCPPLQRREPVSNADASSTPGDAGSGDGSSSPGTIASELTDVLAPYVDRTARSAARSLFEPTPFASLELLRNRLVLERLSPFDHRRGRLQIGSRFGSGEGLRLPDDGLEGRFEVGVGVDRAECVPPVQLGAPDAEAASPLSADLLDRRGADLGLAVAESLVKRLFRASVASGFVCRGLEPLESSDQSSGSLSPRRARLGDVGLGDVPVSDRLRVAITPGDLPEVAIAPGGATLEVTWSDLTVELYGRVARAPVRLLKLTTSFTLGLRPQSGASRRLTFSIDTIDVAEASLQSPWRSGAPEDGTLLQWSRRLLLLVFEETLQLALPLGLQNPLELVGTELRRNDVVFLMRLQ